MPKRNDKLMQQVDELINTPEGKAFLDMIQAAEGGNYDRTFGNRQITDFSKHPGMQVPFTDRNGKQRTSSAAGAFQILKPTWEATAPLVDAKDFSPRNQQRVALALALQKPGMYDAIKAGDLNKITSGVKEVWTSLPGSVSGSNMHGNTRSASFITSAYNGARGRYGLRPVSGLPGAVSSSVGNQQQQLPNNYFYNMAMSSVRPGSSFYQRAMDSITSKSWSDPGRVPFTAMTSEDGNRSVFGSADLTDPAHMNTLMNRLFDPDPTHVYGLSFVDNGLRPTEMAVNAAGEQLNLVANSKGEMFNSDTGVPVTQQDINQFAAGQAVLPPDQAIVPITPKQYNIQAPSQPELQLNPQPVNQPAVFTTGVTSALGETPSSTGVPPGANADGGVSPRVSPVGLNEQLVAALGGDSTTMYLNGLLSDRENARALLAKV